MTKSGGAGVLPAGQLPGDRWTEYVVLDDLPPHPDNPKGHALDAIEALIEDHGYTTPIEICGRSGKIASGHGRREVLMRMRDRGDPAPEGIRVTDGVWLAPVQHGWSSKDDDDLERYIVGHNQSSIAGGWREDGLAAILARQTPTALSRMGFTEAETAKRLGNPPDLRIIRTDRPLDQGHYLISYPLDLHDRVLAAIEGLLEDEAVTVRHAANDAAAEG